MSVAASFARQGGELAMAGMLLWLSQSKGHLQGHQVTVGEIGINAAPGKLV